MENKKWHDVLFKIIIAVLSIIFGAHEYQIHVGGDKVPVVQIEAKP